MPFICSLQCLQYFEPGHLPFCRSFDFEGDDRWRQYAANIEIPPDRDRDSVLRKFKAKWYKREIVSLTTDLKCYQITWHARAF